MRSYVIFTLLLGVVCAGKVSYEGYKVYKVTPNSPQEVSFVHMLENNNDFDFWTRTKQPGHSIDIMVTPERQKLFENYLRLLNIEFEVKIANVQHTIDYEEFLRKAAPKTSSGKITFTDYHTYDEIAAYLTQLQSTYSTVSIESIGKSYEGREIWMIRISSGGSGKPVILIDGGIHAREWIAPATVLYIIQELVENPSNANLIADIDWAIIPVLNPDGYQYSMTDDRFWRKTRSVGDNCTGVDPNRNFDFHWAEIGSSSNECNLLYHGPSAFSEIEARDFRDLVLNLGSSIKLYLTFHSFGKYILYPWGYTLALPEDADELQSLGDSVAAAIESVNGTNYTVGSTTHVIYPAAGASDDWAKGVGGVALAYTIELPGGGILGFDLPPERIIPVATETWPGVVVYHDYIKNKFGSN